MLEEKQKLNNKRPAVFKKLFLSSTIENYHHHLLLKSKPRIHDVNNFKLNTE